MNLITASESTIELPSQLAQEPSISKIIELYPTDDQVLAPRARIVLAQNQTGDLSYQAQRYSCRYLLQKLLCSISTTQKHCWQLNYSAAGAPGLAPWEDQHLHVSMAHSADWLAAGVSYEAAIGVDIECIKPRKNISGKVEFLGWKVPVCNNQDFHAKWTLWEASAKCVKGSALTRANPGFEKLCHVDTRDKVGRSGQWSGLHGHLDEKVVYAVVLHGQTDTNMSQQVLRHEDIEPWSVSDTH